jgi:hypothetical protein
MQRMAKQHFKVAIVASSATRQRALTSAKTADTPAENAACRALQATCAKPFC